MTLADIAARCHSCAHRTPPPPREETGVTELDLDGIEARATDIANYLRSEPVVFLVGAMHARVSLLTCDVRVLVAEVRRLRAALTGRQTMAAVYGYELGLADAAGTDTDPPTSGE